jgi:hypothetical protein
VSDLRTLVIRRAGKGRRVALLSGDEAIVRGLQENACTVLVDPPGPDELRAFEPQAVVAFDGALEGGALFGVLAEVVPNAELVFSCANAGGASTLVRQLVGRDAPKGQALEPLEQRLQEAGYRIVSRDNVVTPFQPSGLSADAEAALRALFEQVNPQAAADRWLCVARRGEPAAVQQVPGLLSVVTPEPQVSGYTHEQVRRLEDARGQYVTFRRRAVPPGHDERLLTALKNGTAAWAIACGVSSVRHALLEGRVAREGWMVDRERIGPFALSVPDEAPAADAVLFARLAAVFPPVFVPGPSPEPVEGVRGALEAMKARPLRMLTTLDALVGDEPPLHHTLADKLDDQLKQRAPNLRRVLRGLFEPD